MGIPTNLLYLVNCVGTTIGRPQIHNQIRGFSKGCNGRTIKCASVFILCGNEFVGADVDNCTENRYNYT